MRPCTTRRGSTDRSTSSGSRGSWLPWPGSSRAAGLFSSVLDNAPTYVVFFEAARSLPAGQSGGSVRLLSGGTIQADLLTAVSLGSVFMGAITYIGNGPNFMVKSIAERYGV